SRKRPNRRSLHDTSCRRVLIASPDYLSFLPHNLCPYCTSTKLATCSPAHLAHARAILSSAQIANVVVSDKGILGILATKVLPANSHNALHSSIVSFPVPSLPSSQNSTPRRSRPFSA